MSSHCCLDISRAPLFLDGPLDGGSYGITETETMAPIMMLPITGSKKQWGRLRPICSVLGG
jgi:hypothetical protein